jgi:3-methyladenine DNA glycosylase AlkD
VVKSRDENIGKRNTAKRLRRAIEQELRRHIDVRYRKGAEAYFKEGIVLHGVRASKVREIGAGFFRKVKTQNKAVIYCCCEELLGSGYSEEKTIAFGWAFRLRRHYEPADFRLFESWLRKYVRTWGSCDDFCRHAFGVFVYRFPEFLPDVLAWTKAKNRWLRRGAAVIMIYSLRKGEHLSFSLKIADALMTDEDYLVQNGYGWMLKDASISFPAQVLKYVTKHKNEMPRRALRYAIERYSAEQRHAVMAKG